MRLPKGASYKILSTKNISLDSLLEELGSKGFSGYVRVTVERDKKIQDGYLLLKDGKVVAAEFDGEELIESKKAFKKIKDSWKLEGIVDIYKFTEFQIQLSIEENADSMFSPAVMEAAKKTAQKPETKKIKRDDKIPESLRPAAGKAPKTEIPTPKVLDSEFKPEVDESEEDRARSVTEDILEKKKERVALLKKFGLREPEDDFVDSILKTFKLPSDKELNTKSRELKKEILIRLKEKTDLEELDLYINSSKLGNAVEFNIDVYVKPFNKEIEKEVKSEIEAMLKEKLPFPYEKGLTINSA